MPRTKWWWDYFLLCTFMIFHKWPYVSTVIWEVKQETLLIWLVVPQLCLFLHKYQFISWHGNTPYMCACTCMLFSYVWGDYMCVVLMCRQCSKALGTPSIPTRILFASCEVSNPLNTQTTLLERWTPSTATPAFLWGFLAGATPKHSLDKLNMDLDFELHGHFLGSQPCFADLQLCSYAL